MSTFEDYLSKKYGTLPGGRVSATTEVTKKKKKKRKIEGVNSVSSEGKGYAIIDEEEITSQWKKINSADEDELKELAAIVETESNASKWKKITDYENEDEAPQIAQIFDETSSLITSESMSESSTKRTKIKRSRSPSSSTAGKISSSAMMSTGLQSAEKAHKEHELRQKEIKAELERMDPELSGRNAPTVYRDRTGRKIDIAAQRAEEHDRDLNEEMKAKERWNDPAASFLSKKKKTSQSKRPKYEGPPPPPNRFNIQPGYRWDGIGKKIYLL
ncbi:10772_t:CDS:2 [Ambispora gerdemannii]|uniref:10772_t:CDS:1 n=1 Tax=Ambispora gerdemannii TaxID=144530 RepID=A0A9N9F908_9GLOM|nr:10772_t:CDS:2 [Ambispora gerdemannii]